jgi:hypothetical protein
MTLLRELIDIPDHVHQGDFVLKLTEGVTDPKATLDAYVVTEQLAECFDEALQVVGGAVTANGSKAAYLHGSFGSGKSHFMAVLDFLLAGNADARAIPELAPVVAKHDTWLADRRFLLVPLHLIGARSLEDGIFNGYLAHVRRLHPDAPLPAIFRAGPILDNADRLRLSMGDDKFFEALNLSASSASSGGGAAGGASSGWGALAAGWDADSYGAARAAVPGDPDQARLIGDLTATLLSAFADHARSSDDPYIDFDDGLAALSQHAAALGYQGLVLFLDELVLWLVSRVADVAFVTREASKLTHLVESSNPDRPAPIVSFVARQRDLSEFVGEHALGNEFASLQTSLNYVSGRLPNPIRLEDRNLRAIASRRLLAPVDDGARRQIDAAFHDTQQVRPEVLATMLGSHGDPEQFRQTYPFSPAFMDTLVAVSGALQRERTALKVMRQLLVDRRDTLELGQVVPVGDLWDVVESTDEPFAPELKVRFAAAKKLYHGTLHPLLLDIHGVSRDQAAALPATHGLRADERLVKTLLLAALVTEVEPLKDLTVNRLAALNHGAINTPLPGTEAQMVLSTLRKLGQRTGAVRLGDAPANPTVGVVISGVDTSGILDAARHVDTDGERKRLLRRMVEERLGVTDSGQFRQVHAFLWRGTKRRVELVFANVRDAQGDLPDEQLLDTGDGWKVVVDFPFDAAGRGPREDLQRVQSLRNAGRTGRVLCWLPSFFTAATARSLGELVVLDHVLTGDRFQQFAGHLSAADKTNARGDLENQRARLREGVRAAIDQAYGVATDDPAVVDTSLPLADRFPTLWPDMTVRPPVASTLGDAFGKLLDQLLTHDHPAHPAFETEVRPADLRKVYAEAQRALADPDHRVIPESGLRPVLKRIANPLRLGIQSEQPFVLEDHWKNHLVRAIGQLETQGEPVSVGALRGAFDDPQPMGLPREIQDLVLLVGAEWLGYSFTRHGGAYPGGIGDLPDDLELRRQPLPSAHEWATARDRGGRLFGVTVGPALTPGNVAELAGKVVDAAAARRDPAARLRDTLAARVGRYGVADDAPRLVTARAAAALTTDLARTPPDDVAPTLAVADLPTTVETLDRSLASSEQVTSTLDAVNWSLLDGAFERPEGAPLRAELVAALAKDEFAQPLGPVLDSLQRRATDVVIERPPPREPEPLPVPVPPDQPRASPAGAAGGATGGAANTETVSEVDQLNVLYERWAFLLADHHGARITIQWQVTPPSEETESAEPTGTEPAPGDPGTTQPTGTEGAEA